MARAVWQKTVTDNTGAPSSGAQVTVTIQGGGVATIFSQQSGGTASSNPFNTGSDGIARFYADRGYYNVTVSKGQSTVNFPWNNLGDNNLFDDLANTAFVESTTFTQSLLASADAAEARTTLGVGGGTDGLKDYLIQRNSFEMIAHRGFKGSNPENTMLAFTTAVRQGADALELDLQVTSDGVVVVFHDALMQDKTNLTGTIASKTLTQVQSATYNSVQSSSVYFNVRIPTLAEVIEYAKEVDIKLFMEIKNIRTFSDIALMINQVKDAGILDKCSFTSFQIDRVAEARRIEPNVEVGLIGFNFQSSEYIPIFDNLALLGGKLVIVWSKTSLIDHPAVGVYARSKGIDIVAYTLESSTNVRKLVALGITRIIANVPLRGR